MSNMYNRLVYEFTSLALQYTDEYDIDIRRVSPDEGKLSIVHRGEGYKAVMISIFNGKITVYSLNKGEMYEFDELPWAKIKFTELALEK